jgi:hypothetical protein
MDCARIQTDATERVEALMLDGSLSPLTGLSDVLLAIRRISDGFFYDFNDDTFKSTGWTTRQQVMTETDSTNDQGVYHYNFDTSAITNAAADDTYQLRVDCASAANVPQVGELKVGQYVDDIDQALSVTESNIRGGDGDDLQDLSQQLDAVQTDLDNPSQYQADVSGLAPAGEYDTEMANLDATISSRAPANEYDTQLDAAISSRAPANEYDTQLDATISSRAPAGEYDTELDATISSRAPAGEYDTELDAAISSRAPANEYDTQLDAAISSRAPANEYDTQLDATISSRAPAGEYDTEMANLDAAITSRAPAGEYDTELDATISSRAPAGEYDTEMANLDAAITSRAPANEYDAILATMSGDITFIKDIEGGRWHLTGGQMIFYEDDNVTEVARFDITLDGSNNPIERTRV